MRIHFLRLSLLYSTHTTVTPYNTKIYNTPLPLLTNLSDDSILLFPSLPYSSTQIWLPQQILSGQSCPAIHWQFDWQVRVVSVWVQSFPAVISLKCILHNICREIQLRNIRTDESTRATFTNRTIIRACAGNSSNCESENNSIWRFRPCPTNTETITLASIFHTTFRVSNASSSWRLRGWHPVVGASVVGASVDEIGDWDGAGPLVSSQTLPMIVFFSFPLPNTSTQFWLPQQTSIEQSCPAIHWQLYGQFSVVPVWVQSSFPAVISAKVSWTILVGQSNSWISSCEYSQTHMHKYSHPCHSRQADNHHQDMCM